MPRKCEVRHCTRDHYALGLCFRHYDTARRRAKGMPEVGERVVGTPARCTVDGCGRDHRANGYCLYHLTRWKRYGDPCEPRRKGDPWTAREDELIRVLPTGGRSGRVKPGALSQLALELGRSIPAVRARRHYIRKRAPA